MHSHLGTSALLEVLGRSVDVFELQHGAGSQGTTYLWNRVVEKFLGDTVQKVSSMVQYGPN